MTQLSCRFERTLLLALTFLSLGTSFSVPHLSSTIKKHTASVNMASTTETAATCSKKGSQFSYLPTQEAFATPDGKASITFEDIAKYPGRAFLSRAGAPTKIGFTPDNESLVYLGASEAGSLTQQLYKRTIIVDGTISPDADSDVISVLAKPPEGVGEEDTLSAEEKLRRERTRQLTTGITNFEYSANKKVLLCPIGNDLFIQNDGDEELTMVVNSKDLPGSLIDPHISDDGSMVAFVCNKELYIASTTVEDDKAGCQPPTRMTFDADQSKDGNGIVNGLADFIAMEEMSRNEGFWISPDSKFVAFEQSDESHIPNFRIMHQGQADPSTQEDHRYPFAGEANPTAKIGILKTENKDDGKNPNVLWLDINSVFGEDMYLARVEWGVTSPFRENQHLYVQVMNREQTELVLLRFDIDEEIETNAPLKGTELIRETAKEGAWHNLHDIFIPLKSGGFVWASESETGFRHLYLHDGDGRKIVPITRDMENPDNDDWMVDTCTADMVNQNRDTYYFTGTKDGAKESHLYRASMDGFSQIQRITPEGGVHQILAMNILTGIFVDSWSSINEPHKVAVRSLEDGSILRMLHDGSEAPEVSELSLPPPEWFDVQSTATNENLSGQDSKVLHGAVYKPDPKVHGDGPYPAIVSLYGGPHAQMVTDSYGMTVDLRAQRLRAQGYVVIKVDNRGSARRGLDFETAIRHDMGNLEVEDQVEAVKYWIDKGLVDPNRVGVYGWSYGGYMSAMCLAKRPDVFSAAVAGAMVSSWDGYDTCYTERYMGTPQSNPEGYSRSEVMPYVDQIDGSLLLVHGLIDENVHFRHTARLVNALIKARKHYELLMFPDERHVPRGLQDKVFMEERISSFLERSL